MTLPTWKYDSLARDGVLIVTNTITKESRRATYTVENLEEKEEELIKELEGIND
jgi:hypothetical protein